MNEKAWNFKLKSQGGTGIPNAQINKAHAKA